MFNDRYPQEDNHVAERTKKRRPLHGLSPGDVSKAKRMRDKQQLDFEEISKALGFPVRDVEIALTNTRSPNPQNPQACIWTNRSTRDRLREKELPGETRGRTLLRVLEEHAHFERLFKG